MKECLFNRGKIDDPLTKIYCKVAFLLTNVRNCE